MSLLLLHPVKHYLTARPRLLIAVGAGILVYFFLPASFSTLMRLTIAWNVLAWLYLFFLWWLMMRAQEEDIRHIARIQDESASTVLSLVSVTCLVSILVILLELSMVKHLSGTSKVMHLVLTGTTLIGSWALLPTAFAMHYAHLFYRTRAQPELALLFPNDLRKPRYWDFLYFSFTIGVASQTADVAIGSSDVRRIALLQSVLSFIFNLVILGLSINVCAGLLS